MMDVQNSGGVTLQWLECEQSPWPLQSLGQIADAEEKKRTTSATAFMVTGCER